MKVKRLTKAGYIRQILYQILPAKLYVKICYYWFSKKCMNINNPQRLSEKWWWVMYYNKKHYPDLICTVADKAEVISYLEERGFGNYIKKTYGIYDSVDDIDFSQLPNRFALKLSKASGYNVICTDKEKFDVDDAKAALRKMSFLLNKRKWISHELAWMNKGTARIVCEEFLEKKDGSQFTELNFYCFHGEPKFTLVINDYLQDNGDIDHNFTRNLYDVDWNPINVEANHQRQGRWIEKPTEYDEAVKVARSLAKDFLFIRIDLYVGDGRILFSEITPAPAGLTCFEPDEYDFIFCNMLTLPDENVFV